MNAPIRTKRVFLTSFHSPLLSSNSSKVFEYTLDLSDNLLIREGEASHISHCCGYFQNYNFGRTLVALLCIDNKLQLIAGEEKIQLFPSVADQSIEYRNWGLVRKFTCSQSSQAISSIKYIVPFGRELLLDGIELDHSDLLRFVATEKLEPIYRFLCQAPKISDSEKEILDNLKESPRSIEKGRILNENTRKSEIDQ